MITGPAALRIEVQRRRRRNDELIRGLGGLGACDGGLHRCHVSRYAGRQVGGEGYWVDLSRDRTPRQGAKCQKTRHICALYKAVGKGHTTSAPMSCRHGRPLGGLYASQTRIGPATRENTEPTACPTRMIEFGEGGRCTGRQYQVHRLPRECPSVKKIGLPPQGTIMRRPLTHRSPRSVGPLKPPNANAHHPNKERSLQE